MPPFRAIAPVVWEMDADMRQALRTEPTPAQNCTYVPTVVQNCLLTWAPVAGHPGISRTIACLTEKYFCFVTA